MRVPESNLTHIMVQLKGHAYLLLLYFTSFCQQQNEHALTEFLPLFENIIINRITEIKPFVHL